MQDGNWSSFFRCFGTTKLSPGNESLSSSFNLSPFAMAKCMIWGICFSTIMGSSCPLENGQMFNMIADYQNRKRHFLFHSTLLLSPNSEKRGNALFVIYTDASTVKRDKGCRAVSLNDSVNITMQVIATLISKGVTTLQLHLNIMAVLSPNANE